MGKVGDIFCTEGDCKIGEMAIGQMGTFYASLKVKNVHQPYEVGVKAILEAYEKARSSWTRQIPFTTVCCQIKQLGVQAISMTQSMSKKTGDQAPLAFDPGQGSITAAITKGAEEASKTTSSWLPWILLGGLVAGGLYFFRTTRQVVKA
jgi:hypothetical protein